MKKIFTLIAAFAMSAVSFAQNSIPGKIDLYTAQYSTTEHNEATEPNGEGIVRLNNVQTGTVVSFPIANSEEQAYDITFKQGTCMSGITIDFEIEDAANNVVYSKVVDIVNTNPESVNFEVYTEQSAGTTPVLPVGAYTLKLYYNRSGNNGTYQGTEFGFTCNVSEIAFAGAGGAAATAEPIVIDLSKVIASGPNGHYAEDTQKLDYFCYGETATLPFEVKTASAYNLAIDYATIISHFGATFTIKNSADAAVWQEVIELDHTTANEGDNDWTIIKTVNAATNTPVLEPGNYVLFIEYNVQGTWEGNPHQFTANIHKLVLNGVAGGNATAAFEYLGGSNFDVEASENTLYKFTGTDFTLSMNNRDKNRTPRNFQDDQGNQWSSDVINFKNNDWGIINVPAGKKVYALAIGGYSESTAGNLCYLYTVDVDDKNIFTEAIGQSVTDNTTINNAKYIILPDGTAPQFALLDLTAAPAANGIKVIFSGNNQEDVWFKLYTSEEDANAVLGKGGQPSAGNKVIYSWVGAEAGATEVGGKAVATDGESVNYANAGNWTIRINKKKDAIATDNVTITLDEALAEGDVIAITAYRNKDTDANGTLYMLFENGAEIDEGSDIVWNNIHEAIGQQPNTRTFTVGAEAGSKTIKIARSAASTNVFITKIEITRGGATGIKNVEVVNVKPANDAIYNLRGQRVDASYKGIVIMNGKKFFQK